MNNGAMKLRWEQIERIWDYETKEGRDLHIQQMTDSRWEVVEKTEEPFEDFPYRVKYRYVTTY